MELGDSVVDHGSLKGRVVANIDRGEFSPEYPEDEWGYLTHGVLVHTEEAGLVHYENPGKLTLVPNT